MANPNHTEALQRISDRIKGADPAVLEQALAIIEQLERRAAEGLPDRRLEAPQTR